MLTLKQAENVFRSGTPSVDRDRTFEGFLYGYEPKLNEIVRRFLGKRAFNPETFMDYKLACAATMLERWEDFDAGKGIQFSTFAHHDVMNALLRARMLEGITSMCCGTASALKRCARRLQSLTSASRRCLKSATQSA